MNYTELIDRFWATRKAQRLSGNATKLFFWLINEASLSEWPEYMCIENSKVCTVLGMSLKSLAVARNDLMNDKLIVCKSTKGVTEYSFVTKTRHNNR